MASRDDEFIISKANGWRSQIDRVALVDLPAGTVAYVKAEVVGNPDAQPPVVGVPAGFMPYQLGLSAALKATVCIVKHSAKAGDGVSAITLDAEYNDNLVTFPAGTKTEAAAQLALKHVVPFPLS